jgi:hypothetical protein
VLSPGDVAALRACYVGGESGHRVGRGLGRSRSWFDGVLLRRVRDAVRERLPRLADHLE